MTHNDLKQTHDAEMQGSAAPELIWFTKVGEDIVPNSRRLTDEDTEYLRADLAPSPEAFEQMREALEWYAEEQHSLDGGRRARAAIKAAEESK